MLPSCVWGANPTPLNPAHPRPLHWKHPLATKQHIIFIQFRTIAGSHKMCQIMPKREQKRKESLCLRGLTSVITYGSIWINGELKVEVCHHPICGFLEHLRIQWITASFFTVTLFQTIISPLTTELLNFWMFMHLALCLSCFKMKSLLRHSLFQWDQIFSKKAPVNFLHCAWSEQHLTFAYT